MEITICGAEGREQELVLKTRERAVRISYQELEYVEVMNKKVSFYLTDGTAYEVRAALSDFEGLLLTMPEFLKTHRSYLVNLRHVRSVDGGCVVTKNGHRIPVSRQRRGQVQEACIRFERSAVMTVEAANARAAKLSEKSERPPGPWRILLVDDDASDRALWADILHRHGCVVCLARSGREALQTAAVEPFDCVLLDVMIPGEDGFAICDGLCRVVQAPVIFLSSLTEADKQLQGFAAGGIDYITKDTSEELFWAKVETRIRLAMSDRTQLRFGSLLLDLSERKALIREQALLLTPLEFDILWRMAERAGHIFTPEELFDLFWKGQPWDGGQMVQIHMSRLRRKLEKAGEDCHYIGTVWGKGYCFSTSEP